MKYSPDLTKKITDLIERDTFTIEEICKSVKLALSTYHKWIAEKKDFSDAVKKAKELQQDNIALEARKSLMKKVKGYDYDETTIEYGTRKVIENGVEIMQPYQKSNKVVKKHVPASDTLIIFTTSNTDNRFKRTDQPEKEKETESKTFNITISSAEDLAELENLRNGLT